LTNKPGIIDKALGLEENRRKLWCDILSEMPKIMTVFPVKEKENDNYCVYFKGNMQIC